MSWDPPAEGTESHFDTLLRSLVISRLGRAEDPEVRAEAKRRFDLHASGETPIKADIRSEIGFYKQKRSIPIQCRFDTDPNPGICTIGLRIRILLFS